jgi:hypothetical protein
LHIVSSILPSSAPELLDNGQSFVISWFHAPRRHEGHPNGSAHQNQNKALWSYDHLWE